jgi:predicted Zn-dependent protease
LRHDLIISAKETSSLLFKWQPVVSNSRANTQIGQWQSKLLITDVPHYHERLLRILFLYSEDIYMQEEYFCFYKLSNFCDEYV